jgi:hypothetical protein
MRRPGPTRWGFGVGLTAPPRKNPVVRKSKEGYGPQRTVMIMMTNGVDSKHSCISLAWSSGYR